MTAPFDDGEKCNACYLPKFWNLDKKTCEYCNAGRYYDVNLGRCADCPDDSPKSVNGKCQKCP